MMILCVTSAPVDQQEIRIDLLGDRGYVDTLLVRREETGFAVYDEVDGKRVKVFTVVPKEGAENVFTITVDGGERQTVDLKRGIKELDIAELRTSSRLRLKTVDGQDIAVDRSGTVTFVTLGKPTQTYVVH